MQIADGRAGAGKGENDLPGTQKNENRAAETTEAEIAAAAAQCRALWPEAAQALDLPAEGVRFRQLRTNSRLAHRRAVFAVTVPQRGAFVLRADFAQEEKSRLISFLDRHRRAADAVAEVEGVNVPRILWQQADSANVVMEFVEGATVFQELSLAEYGVASRDDVLTRVGRSVAALHNSDSAGTRRFWPKVFLERVGRHAQAVRSGKLDLPRPKRFLGLCAYLHRAGRQARGQAFQGALEHGDLHFRNILIAPEAVSFIDFSNSDAVFFQRDLANLWLANCPDHLATSARDVGFGAVAAADWAAFEAGYGTGFTKDPVFRFFFAFRVFTLWVRQGERPRDEMEKAKRVVQGLNRVFGALQKEEEKAVNDQSM